ncbi:MAG: Smr/MutS family protein [Steroidobacteraceae bacterium]
MAGSKRRVNIAGERSRGEARASFEEHVSGKASAQERALFREATRGVRPLEHDRHVASGAKPPAPLARFTRADRTAILDESLSAAPDDPYLAGGEVASYARPGVQRSVLLGLRRGHYRVQAELDLHGLTVNEGKQALRGFLAEALHRNARCVRIIHGKGLRSGPRGPVLKAMVTGLLRRSSRVIAFVSAREVDGGTGALYALLSPP